MSFRITAISSYMVICGSPISFGAWNCRNSSSLVSSRSSPRCEMGRLRWGSATVMCEIVPSQVCPFPYCSILFFPLKKLDFLYRWVDEFGCGLSISCILYCMKHRLASAAKFVPLPLFSVSLELEDLQRLPCNRGWCEAV